MDKFGQVSTLIYVLKKLEHLAIIDCSEDVFNWTPGNHLAFSVHQRC